jgi:hypothetical protein
MEQKHRVCQRSITETKRKNGNDNGDIMARKDGGTNNILNRIILKKPGSF